MLARLRKLFRPWIPAVCGLLLLGCGGSGGGGSTMTAAAANEAFKSASIGSFQANQAAVNVPFQALMLAAPTSFSSKLGKQAVRKPSGLTFIPSLNLYSQVTNTNSTITITFYTDSGGTQSAGTVTVDATAVLRSGATFPATATVTANITGGNIPLTGTVNITFKDAGDANTMTGTLNLTKSGTTVKINLALDDRFNATGSCEVDMPTSKLLLTNVSGTVTAPLNATAQVTPYNWSGTATFNLLTGQISLNLKTSDGAAVTTMDSGGDLQITFGDGTQTTVTNPATATVDGSSGSGGSGSGGSGSGSANYAIAALAGSPVHFYQATPDGQILTGSGRYNSANLLYYASPTATPVNVTVDPTLAGILQASMNTKGQIVAYGTDTSSNFVLRYWASPTATPVPLTLPAAYTMSYTTLFIQTSGRILISGTSLIVNGTPSGDTSNTLVMSSPTDANPYVMLGGSVTAVNDGNVAVGTSNTAGDGNMYVWPTISASTTPIAIPGTNNGHIKSVFVAASGTVGVSDAGSQTSWLSHGPGYTDQVAITAPTGTTWPDISSIGPNDEIVGSVDTDYTSLDNEGMLWTAPTKPVDLRASSAPFVLSGLTLLTNGDIIAVGIPTAGVSNYVYYLLTPK